jgi:hypothetical protein
MPRSKPSSEWQNFALRMLALAAPPRLFIKKRAETVVVITQAPTVTVSKSRQVCFAPDLAGIRTRKRFVDGVL